MKVLAITKDGLKHSGHDDISLRYNPRQQQEQDKIDKEKT